MKQSRVEKLMLEAARTFNSTLEYEELIEMVLKLVMAAVGSEASAIYRHDTDRRERRTRFMSCVDWKVITIGREPSAGVVGWIIDNHEAVIINDAASDPRLDHEMGRITGLPARSLLALPLIGRGKLIGVIEAVNKLKGEFDQTDLDVLRGLNNQIAVAIDNAYLYREAKREALEKTLLYEIGQKLSGKLSLQEVLGAILDSLKQVVTFDSGGVFLCDERGLDLNAIYTVGYAAESQSSLHMKCDEGLVGAAATSGKEVIVDDVTTDSRYIQANPSTRSEIAVPIKVNDRVIGVINLESPDHNSFDRRHVSLMRAFASQAGMSIERARLHERDLQAKQLEAQLNVARETQRTFLPKGDPVIPGYDIAGQNVPSGQVGGDYYDFIKIVDSNLGVVVADVSGKGMPAALVMASFRASLIAEIRNNYSICTIGQKVNALLCESLETGMYVTAVYGVLDLAKHVFTYSNFGHNPPILLRRNGKVELLTVGGVVLGVNRQATFEERAFTLQLGDMIVMYTDGVTEVFDSDGREFGSAGLIEVVKANSARRSVEIAGAIREAVSKHASATHVYDDLTVVVIKRNA
ncbi:MAG: SpoIIE family protein phosphatase [candidate division Zixibacteria bacterium]|nr:SpoIIE family protein phosphatase [candidate division Zixibacteria bacterium]